MRLVIGIIHDWFFRGPSFRTPLVLLFRGIMNKNPRHQSTNQNPIKSLIMHQSNTNQVFVNPPITRQSQTSTSMSRPAVTKFTNIYWSPQNSQKLPSNFTPNSFLHPDDCSPRLSPLPQSSLESTQWQEACEVPRRVWKWQKGCARHSSHWM